MSDLFGNHIVGFPTMWLIYVSLIGLVLKHFLDVMTSNFGTCTSPTKKRQCPDMTIAVDWYAKPQLKQTNKLKVLYNNANICINMRTVCKTGINAKVKILSLIIDIIIIGVVAVL